VAAHTKYTHHKNIHAAYKHTNTYIIHSSKACEIANRLLPKTVHLRNIRW